MKKYLFTLHISADDYQQYYSGQANMVQVRSQCGKNIRFPASKLREFVFKDGIHGAFEMELDNNNRFRSLRKISQ